MAIDDDRIAAAVRALDTCTVHAWPVPEGYPTGSDYWTHLLDANSKYKVARRVLEAAYPPPARAALGTPGETK